MNKTNKWEKISAANVFVSFWAAADISTQNMRKFNYIAHIMILFPKKQFLLLNESGLKTKMETKQKQLNEEWNGKKELGVLAITTNANK